MKPLTPFGWMLMLVLSPMLLWAQTSQEIDTSQPMTLQECINYAYQHSATVENAALEQQIAKRDVTVTKTQGFPQISANAGYTNNFKLQTTVIEPGSFPGAGNDPNGGAASDEEIEFQFGIAHQLLAGATLNQLIFDGSYFIGLKAARVYTDLVQKGYDQSRITTAEQVTKAYYTALINQDRQALLTSNYNRLDTLLRETQLMFENGFAEEIDVDRIRVQFNNAQTDKDKNDRLTEVSYLLLKFQMGMPIEEDITLADEISDIEFDFALEEESDFSYADRTEYQQILINQELTSLDLRNNRAQYLPKLTANATYGYATGASNFVGLTDLDDRFLFGNWGINLNIPIFDGLRKHNLIQKNKIQLQQLENQTDFLENQIDLEIVQSRVNLQNSVQTLKVQEENLELAQKVFEVTKIKYQEGVGSNLEVIEAQNALQQAETNYYSALYDALIAQVDLKRALGTLTEDTITE